MTNWQTRTDNHNRREWFKGDYSIIEMKRPIDEKEYFIYHKLNFLTVRLTPEHAKEYCDIRAGKM